MKKIALALCATALAFSLISCGSKPEPEPEVEPQAPVVEEVKEEPVTSEAEPTIVVVEETKTEEPEIEEPTVFDNTDALNALDASRAEAINSGAEKYAAEELAGIDALYNELKKRAENGEDLSKELAELQKAYEIIAVYAKAMELKTKIDDEDLAQYALNVYNDGVKLIDEIDDSEEWTDNLLAKSQEAYAKFNTVCIQGYKALARQAREDAYEAKRNADGVKAGVARKEKYNEAVENFKLGDSLYAMQSPEKSIEKYELAEEVFIDLYEELYEARAAAMKAIEEAKRKVAESEKLAEQADVENPLSESEDDGMIEDEDTVLLEEDDYEDPEEAEADIPEEFDFGDDEDFDDEESESDETDEEEAL